MKRKVLKISILILAVIVVAGIVFRQQLYDFFISPDGLSIAASEICMKNASASELIVEIDTFVGAKVETFLFEQQQVCAPSPNDELVGKILVGKADSMKYSCEKDVKKAGLVTLVDIGPDGRCEWLN